MAEEFEKRGFFRRVAASFAADRTPMSLGLPPPPVRVLKPPAPPFERFPGNFFTFPVLMVLRVGEQSHIGGPAEPIRNTGTGQTVWGASLDFSWDNPEKDHQPWEDDSANGVNCRTLVNIEDVLGAEGRFLGLHFRFEKVLFLGRNQVVYAFFTRDRQLRIAYGFSRSVFQPGYVPPPRDSR